MSSTSVAASTSEATTGPPHVVLVGLPGAGKSSIGRAVARRLRRPFLDFDIEIERREGMTVAELFAERGEPYFRSLEAVLTRELCGKAGMIVAPGGGWVTNPELVMMLRPPARLIYLRVHPETALRRLARSPNKRPLLMRPDPLSELQRLLEARRPAYESADYYVDADRLDRAALIREVAELIGDR